MGNFLCKLMPLRDKSLHVKGWLKNQHGLLILINTSELSSQRQNSCIHIPAVYESSLFSISASLVQGASKLFDIHPFGQRECLSNITLLR